MPTALSYTSLLSDMQTYSERGGVLDATVAAQLPRLINLAERGIVRDTKIQGFITVLTTNLPANTSTLAKPDGFREVVSMYYGSGTQRLPIFPRSYDYLRVYWPDPAVTGTVQFYADYDYQNWLFAPTPVATISLEILCYLQPPLLDAVTTTNWLTQYAPELLEYRCFWELALFLKDDTAAGRWAQKYQAALGGINTEDMQKIIDRSVTRIEA